MTVASPKGSSAKRLGRASGGGASAPPPTAPTTRTSRTRKDKGPALVETKGEPSCGPAGEQASPRNIIGTTRLRKTSLGFVGEKHFVVSEITLVTADTRSRVEVRCSSAAGGRRTTKAVLLPLDQLDGVIRLLQAAKAEAKARRLLADA